MITDFTDPTPVLCSSGWQILAEPTDKSRILAGALLVVLAQIKPEQPIVISTDVAELHREVFDLLVANRPMVDFADLGAQAPVGSRAPVGARTARSWAAERCGELLRTVAQPVRIVYTDGSHRSHTTSAGVAWVDTEGAYWCECVKSYDILSAEIKAISHAIRSCDKVITKVTVRSDSKKAIRVVATTISSREVPNISPMIYATLSRLLEFLVRRDDLKVNLQWVRASLSSQKMLG